MQAYKDAVIVFPNVHYPSGITNILRVERV